MLPDSGRGFEGVVIGEPQRAFYGNQFGLTFPVFTHYGVDLWVPEVGGPIDPGSEAHDLVMTLFGGMSKGERNRIQVRTRAAMMDLAARTDRFLGGRPPYGYILVDAGPHPNPGRAANGQRAHHLVPDQDSADVVRRIFELYVAGAGLRTIAQTLTDEGVPSPSAHDPRRNPHRDPRGWAFSAVRSILTNEAYTGRRVWAKQRKVEELIDPDDVAAGSRTRLRWRDEEQWIRSETRTHQALITDDLFLAAHGRLASRERGVRKPRNRTHPYALQGLVFCTLCGRRMEGAWRGNRTSGTGRTLYRCLITKNRALPQALAEHPSSLYVREDAILGPLDHWIASLTTPEAIAGHEQDASTATGAGPLNTQLADLDRKIAALILAIESGADLPELTDQLKRRASERAGIQAQIRRLSKDRRLSGDEIQEAIGELGGVAQLLAAADTTVRGEVYRSLGVRLDYDHQARRITVTAEKACVFNRVRRGT